jgi:hypothetical protein
MNFLDAWHQLDYFDGFIFTIWIGLVYYGKCWIDHKFKAEK